MAGKAPWDEDWGSEAQSATAPWDEDWDYGAEEPQVSRFEDAATALTSGIARGAADLAGLPGTIANAFDSGANFLTRSAWDLAGGAPDENSGPFRKAAAFLFPPGGIPDERVNNPLSSGKMREYLSSATGGAYDYEPKYTSGEYAGTIGEFLPGAALGGGNIPNLLRFGVAPAVASETAGQLTEGTAFEGPSRVAAALLTQPLLGAARKGITPFKIDSQRKATVAALQREGIKPTAGQITGNRKLQYLESELGGSTTRDLMGKQGEAFTNAAMRRIGGSGKATPENMTATKKAITDQFDNLSARNTLRADQKLVDDFDDVITEYKQALTPDQKKIFFDYIKSIKQKFNNGKMDGTVYQNARSKLSQKAQNARGQNNDLSDAYRAARNALDNAMDRSIVPADKGLWQSAREEYRNYKTLVDAVKGAGQDAAEGIINPRQLRTAAAKGKNAEYYVTGGSDLGNLARRGNQMLTPLPDSGTAPRLSASMMNSGPAVIGAAAGGGVGAALGHPMIGAGVGAGVGAAVPKVAGEAMMSPWGQRYLTNQLLQAKPVEARYAKLIATLLAQQEQQGTE